MLAVTVTYSGQFWQSQFPALFRHEVVERSIDDVVDAGIERLNDRFAMRPGGVYLSVEQAGKGKASTGHYRRSIHTERRDLTAIINDSNVVYGPWLEGVSSRNERSRFKGYRVWRQTRDWLDSKVDEIVQKRIRSFVERYG